MALNRIEAEYCRYASGLDDDRLEGPALMSVTLCALGLYSGPVIMSEPWACYTGDEIGGQSRTPEHALVFRWPHDTV